MGEPVWTFFTKGGNKLGALQIKDITKIFVQFEEFLCEVAVGVSSCSCRSRREERINRNSS